MLPAKDRIETAITTYKNRKKRILTIDDDKDTCSSLKIVLEQNGLFEVDAFDDPTQALASFKSNRYDAVILDVKMPDIDGFELYKTIKMLDEKIKVCFLTSVCDFDCYRTLYPDMVHTIEKNEDCIIDKPVGIEKLIKEISKMLSSQKGEIIQEIIAIVILWEMNIQPPDMGWLSTMIFMLYKEETQRIFHTILVILFLFSLQVP